MHPDFSVAKIEKKVQKLRDQIWYVIQVLLCIQYQWTENLSETGRVLFQK
jgi:hypothetical protein